MAGFSNSIKFISEVMAKSMQAMPQSTNLPQTHVPVMQMVQLQQHLNTTQVMNNYVQQQQTTLSSEQSFLTLFHLLKKSCLKQITYCDYMISCLTL